MKILHLDYFNNNNKSIPTLNGFNMLYVFGPSYKTLKANFIAAVLYPNLPPGAAWKYLWKCSIDSSNFTTCLRNFLAISLCLGNESENPLRRVLQVIYVCTETRIRSLVMVSTQLRSLVISSNYLLITRDMLQHQTFRVTRPRAERPLVMSACCVLSTLFVRWAFINLDHHSRALKT